MKDALIGYKREFWKILDYFHEKVQVMNSSKIFAGLIVITINIASRFVTIKLSKSVESYLKFTLSRDVLVFCVVWMGSRDIYISLCVTILFTIVMDFLLNEESSFCLLPESFTVYHSDLSDTTKPTSTEIQNAESVLKRAKMHEIT
jgi:hypothetical protein